MKRADDLMQALHASVRPPPKASDAESTGAVWDRRSRREEDREQSPSSFKNILERLVHAVPGAIGAVIIDADGETVDYAGTLPAFHTKLMGAHLRIALDAIEKSPEGATRQLLVRARRASFLVRSLPDGYALAIASIRGAFDVSPRALMQAEWELAVEAGWPRRSLRAWFLAEVEASPRDRLRPHRVRWATRWEPIEVLGTFVGLGRERGYRCRLVSGVELTLVREPAGRWYSDILTAVSEPTK